MCLNLIAGGNMKSYTLKSIGKTSDYMTILREMEDGFVGVRGPYVIKSSTQSWKDIRDLWGEVYAFEVEPVPDVYYKRKH